MYPADNAAARAFSQSTHLVELTEHIWSVVDGKTFSSYPDLKELIYNLEDEIRDDHLRN